jgi:hypothetical protein
MMKTYKFGMTLSEGDKPVAIPINGWVTYDDAEAEIAAAVQREREEIIKELEDWLHNPNNLRTPGEVVNFIKARREKKPGRMMRHVCQSEMDDTYLAARIVNELIDTINEIRGKA